MQPHQYALGAGILWLTALIVLPFLIAKARTRSFALGLDAGKHLQKADFKLQIQSLRDDLAEAAVQAEADQRKHHISVANLKGTISELEARMMSYTGLAVTKSDYEQLTKAAETLQLAQRTWKTAKGTEPWCVRAHNECRGIQNLAQRIHDNLRNIPATTTKVGESA
ncbi:hypothetical protein KC131_18885 [Pseudomonas sp. JQ170]|uniref:hypothetical protein n=1 Tax=unclassified Pseudomonas TaxID=196821 RepID=UPI002656FF1D|nr:MULTISPECIES: hypothetical protein [unclassified Pseudomonas]MDN7142718.1 hypothetical protein [Pseudomonas sp. JQ170]WRO77930.1 hypothetical protein U9R80_09760 [Pseudomonas sp. 170C]